MTQVALWFAPSLILDNQRGRLFLWVPVLLAIGIGGYFSLPIEPSDQVWLGLAFFATALMIIAGTTSSSWGPLILALALLSAGAILAKARVELVAGPVLEFRYYGAIEGRVVKIDRSGSDAPRLTLDRVVLEEVPLHRLPQRVRVSLHGEQPIGAFNAGDRVMLTGHLSPPSGPAEPGGFDFQRHAWFDRLGAVGYTRTPVLRAAAPEDGLSLMIFRLRVSISRAIQEAMPGPAGGFAAAILAGDRSGIRPEHLEDLRATNLAHLLAISGLHMGLFTGLVFAGVRCLCALIPRLALKWPVKKIAACCALAFGAFYLALSGGNVATLRAYIMVSVMFVAVLFDRRAISLRSVAMAAIIVLVVTPEALVSPGFQMSFAATTALVATYSALRRFEVHKWPRAIQLVGNVVFASGVAGLATAPIAAAHFNQFAHYGLIANTLSVPLMGAVIMPAAIVALCLAPFGLWAAPLWVMEQGLNWILFVAGKVAEQPGAVSHIVAPPTSVLVVLSLGLLFVLLWKGQTRWLGTALIAGAFLQWGMVERAQVLISDRGSLIGVMTPDGRALSKAKGDGFVAGIWLENDGAPVDQEIAAGRSGLARDGRLVEVQLGDWRIVQVSGKTALAGLSGCGGADILVSNQVVEGSRPCVVIDVSLLRSEGAIAINVQDDALRIITARDVVGTRPWNEAGQREGIYLPRLLTRN